MTSPVRGLVLSGGGRGAYQVGVIKALEERGIEPEILVGTSIGVVNGALLADGARAADLDLILRYARKHIERLIALGYEDTQRALDNP